MGELRIRPTCAIVAAMDFTGGPLGRAVAPRPPGPPAQRHVSRIVVHRLFKKYCYFIPGTASPPAAPRLLILYGNNGSGKTTVLKLVFHLLSGEDGRGHKTNVAAIPFFKTSVHFSDGIEIHAYRPPDNQTGSFKMEVRQHGAALARASFRISPDGSVSSALSEKQREFLAVLQRVTPRMYFLADDRQIHGLPAEASDTWVAYQAALRFGHQRESNEDTRTRELKAAIDRAENWLRRKIMRASDAGIQSAHSIYADVVSRIAATEQPSADQSPSLDSVAQRLQTLSARSHAFARFGLVPDVPAEPLQAAIASSKPATATIIRSVLSPFLDGIEARLDALSDIYQVMSIFVDLLNGYFFTDKVVHFTVSRGLRLFDREGEPLTAEMLSSGEKHLLVLLCNLIALRDENAIFLIDEPELSLNVKWQRRLIESMLELTSNSSIQFIVASHAFELIAGHKGNVAKVEGTAHGASHD